jgi:hypothetical protein
MATRKLRRFGNGGGVREGQNANIDDETRARARKFVEDADTPKPAVAGRAAPKQRVVSKKELEDSGLSLRDFLNKERGLTRRGESAPAKAKPKADTRDSSNEGRGREMSKEQQFKFADEQARTPEGVARRKQMEKDQAIERVTPETALLPGGSLKVLHNAAKKLAGMGAKKAAESGGSRAVSTAVDDGVTFLGKSGRRQVGGFDEVGSSGARQLGDNATRQLPAPPKQISGPSKAELVAKNRAARADKRRAEMGEENASRHGLDPKSSDYADKAKAVRDNLGGDDFSLGMKRGGKVMSKPVKMAAGGAVKGWGMARGARKAQMR